MTTSVNMQRMAIQGGILLVVIAGLLYMGQNCGGAKNISSLKTLDNFAAGSRVFLNQCSAAPEQRTRKAVAAAMAKVLVLDSDNRHPLTIAAHDALTAVPDPLLMWSMRRYGTVIVSGSTSELCSAALTQPEGGKRRSFDADSLAGCFVYFPKTRNTREVLNFNVANDVAEIQHALLKTFGSAISQLAPEVEPQIYKPLLAFEKNVARAFIADLMDKEQGAFNINALKGMLGKFDARELESALARYVPGERLEQDPLAVFSFDEDHSGTKYKGYAFNKKRFLDFTFAEAFDSYYCNNWGDFNEAKAKAIARGDAPLADARDLVNTRKRMAVFFPRTHKVFAAGINDVLDALNKPGKMNLAGDESGFSLQGGRGSSVPPSRTVQYENTYWSGTKAFFGSIWDNTGGAAANAYGRYTERVEQSVNNYYDNGGKNIVGAVASGVGGGTAKTYDQEVAQPIRDQTQKRFDTQLNGGATINQAATNAVLLAVGDQTGATPFLEGTYGVDTADARFLSNGERAVRVAQGGLQLIDTATGVGGLVGVGKAGTKVASATAREATAVERAAQSSFDVGDAFSGPGAGTGLLTPVDTAVAGPKALQATEQAFEQAASKGLASDTGTFLGKRYPNGQTRLESYAAGMAEDAAPTTLKRGDRVYVVTDASSGTDVDKLVWGADRPPHPDVLGSAEAYADFVEVSALPDLRGGAQRTQARVIELEITADAVPAVNSTIQPNFGKRGGGSQTFMAYNKDQVSGGELFRVVGDTADPARPIGVYQQYDQFLKNFDAAQDAKIATSEAWRGLDAATSQAVQDWGVTSVMNVGYRGAGAVAETGVQPNPSVNLGPANISPFVEPAGASPDVLNAGAEGDADAFNLSH